MVGVGITPPNVLGTPKPASSVMISNTLGAPLGGTTRGGHHGFDCRASSLITPPNLGSGGGSCFPSIVVVALGDPRVPVTCCGRAAIVPNPISREAPTNARAASRPISFKDAVMRSLPGRNPGQATAASFTVV